MRIDHARVEAIAALVAAAPAQETGLNFYSFGSGDGEVVASDMYPSLHHPATLDFFFFACLHQYGFWLGDDDGYRMPLIGRIDGKACKGSDLLWKLCMRGLLADPTMFSPERLACADSRFCERLFTDDDGPVPFPRMRDRLELTRCYGVSLLAYGATPRSIVWQANEAKEPLRVFLAKVSRHVGYSEDPLRKKQLLLAMVLSNRPERFLHVTDVHNWAPIVDYHLMRVALRTGLVAFEDGEGEGNAERAWVDAGTESAIRHATRDAIELVVRESGRTHAVVDHLFWSARGYCPEMEAPRCGTCIFSKGCAKRTALFQPIFPTTAY